MFNRENMMKNSVRPVIKVLVVEDDLESRDLLKKYLEILGCRVDIAKHGIEAIDKVSSNEYAICFIDLQMPLMGGLEAALIIREDKKEMPIIAMTEKTADEDFEDCREAKMTALIVKPIDIVKLRQIILHFGRKQII